MKVKIIRKGLLILIGSISFSSYSQFSINGEANLRTQASNEDTLPFWMFNNERGRIYDNTNLAVWASFNSNYNLTSSILFEAGAGLLIKDGDKDNLAFDELYVGLRSRDFYFNVGRKQKHELYDGLSSSNRSILNSLNSRPMPGIQLGTNGPFFPFSDSDHGIGIETSWNEYLMEEERHVSNARVHHKNLLIVYKTLGGFQIKAGLQHYVMWGGNSITAGQQPEGLKDYLKVISGQSGGENAAGGDQLNALGNHIGGYELYVSKQFPKIYAEVFYNHLFDDKSGMRLGNTPDGRYGIFLKGIEKNSWIDGFMYELYYTKHQSSTTTGNHIWDNYFNNSLYRSGWTYLGKSIGAPFFIPNLYEEPYSSGYVRIGNNKFVAHHLGLSGSFFKKLPYKLIASHTRNYGHYRIAGDFLSDYYPPDDPRGKITIPETAIYSRLDLGVLRSFINLDLILSGDLTDAKNSWGAGIHINKKF